MPKPSRLRLTCKPKSLRMGPIDETSRETLILLHEELEAMYLADVKNLYHEESARQMKISRPTFSKLLKNARRKCAKAFLHSKSLEIVLKSSIASIVFPSDDGETLSQKFNSAKYFIILSQDDKNFYIEEKIENPIYKTLFESGKIPESDEVTKGFGAGKTIPPLLTKATVAFSIDMGKGMQRNLESRGIEVQFLPKEVRGEKFLTLIEKFLQQ